MSVLKVADKANGYCFGTNEDTTGATMRDLASTAMAAREFEYQRTADVREKYMSVREEGEGEDDAAASRNKTREKLGNDLDKVEIGPGFQV